jgi:hypothetical protein
MDVGYSPFTAVSVSGVLAISHVHDIHGFYALTVSFTATFHKRNDSLEHLNVEFIFKILLACLTKLLA